MTITGIYVLCMKDVIWRKNVKKGLKKRKILLKREKDQRLKEVNELLTVQGYNLVRKKTAKRFMRY